MKKLLVVCTCLFLIGSLNAQDIKNVVKINPIGMLFGSASLAYERAISEKSSVLIAPTFGYIKSGGTKYTTFGIGAEYRFYISHLGEAPTGWYVAPGVSYATGTGKTVDPYSSETEKYNVSGFGVKAIGGYQWIWNGGFTLDLNAGVTYVSLKSKDNSQYVTNYSGVLPVLGLALGYAF